jgi:hypothetical protein
MEIAMAKIYRAEGPDRCGVYNGTNAVAYRAINEGDCERRGHHPSPYEDKKLASHWGNMGGGAAGYMARRQWFFGFASVKQFKEWFNTEKSREILAEAGVTLNVYEVPDADFIAGEKQAIFRRDNEKLVKKYDPRKLPGRRKKA